MPLLYFFLCLSCNNAPAIVENSCNASQEFYEVAAISDSQVYHSQQPLPGDTSIDAATEEIAMAASNRSSDSTPKRISWSAQVLSFGRATAFQQKAGSVNPGNDVARLNKYEAGLYIRPELKYETNAFGVWMKPRLNLHADLDESKIFEGRNYSARFYLQELKAKWQLNRNVYLLAGRYVKYLGTTAFFNPSNPYITDNLGTLNPKLEVEPMDFVELNLSTKADWNFSLILNVNDAGKSIYQKPFFSFKRSYGIFAEHYGESENVGFLSTVDEGGKFHLGWYGHKNVNEALVVWTDCALDHRINRFYPVAGHHTNLLNYEMVNGDRNDGLFFTGLTGASYTFKSGPTLQLNYLYNGKGYDKQLFNTHSRMISSSSDYNFEITKQLSNLNLGRSLNTGSLYLRRHYIFSQLGDTDIFGQLDYNFRYLYSPDDRGSQVSSLLEWNIKDNLQIYSVSLANFGSRSDLRKLVKFQIMAGLIYKL